MAELSGTCSRARSYREELYSFELSRMAMNGLIFAIAYSLIDMWCEISRAGSTVLCVNNTLRTHGQLFDTIRKYIL